MRLTIKDGNKTNGAQDANGASRANGASAPRSAAAATTTAKARDGAKRPVLATVLRAIDGTTADVREALLQILSGVRPYVPRIRVRESTEAIVISGRLLHVDEDTVEVMLAGRTLQIYGGMSSQRESTRRAYRSVRKVYRTFERTIPIGCDVDRDSVVATLRDGFLKIHVPRKPRSIEQSNPLTADSKWAGVA